MRRVAEQLVDVAVHQVDDRTCHCARVGARDLGAQAKVDQHERAGRVVDEEVPRVRVGVKKAKVEELRNETAHAERRELGDDVARLARELLPDYPFRREHLARRRGREHGGHTHACGVTRWQSARQLRGEAPLVRGLVFVVELAVRCARECFDETDVECARGASTPAAASAAFARSTPAA